ncbi:MAG: protein phosphatase CheZ [Halothiobacillus sp.]|nr:protein phosphatase CheZ [Halothiobacillus sp.]
MDEEEKRVRLNQARALLAAAEAGDEADFERQLAALTAGQRQPVFEQVGLMTREVHEALMAFALDERLDRMAEAEMPDARDRLRYVISLTEQAATRTLALVEEAFPVTERLVERSERLQQQLAQVAQREADNRRLVEVIHTISDYLDSVLGSGNTLKSHLTEVMMAQEFQDLSGQLLMRVISLLEQLESKMVSLLHLTSPETVSGDRQKKDGDMHEDLQRGTGPALPKASSDVVKSQDDVDDLLASLGF